MDVTIGNAYFKYFYRLLFVKKEHMLTISSLFWKQLFDYVYHRCLKNTSEHW